MGRKMKKSFRTRKIKLNSHTVEIIEPVGTISLKEFEKEMKTILKGIRL